MVRKYLSVGLVMNSVIMHLNVLKERKGIKEILSLEDLMIVCMQIKMRNLRKELRVSDDELGFVAIKEEDLDIEIREKNALVL